jgi:hypothetical protein
MTIRQMIDEALAKHNAFLDDMADPDMPLRVLNRIIQSFIYWRDGDTPFNDLGINDESPFDADYNDSMIVKLAQRMAIQLRATQITMVALQAEDKEIMAKLHYKESLGKEMRPTGPLCGRM